MISPPLIGYVLTAARRDKLMMTLIMMIVLGASLSVFLGGAAVVEGEQFSLVFAAGGLRFLGVTGLVLFVSFYLNRAFAHKEVEFLLSRPISRMTFLLSHAVAFMLIAVMVAVFVIVPMFMVGAPHPDGLAVWALSLAIEYCIVAVTALFFAMVLSSAAGAALSTFGFYVLSRMIGVLIGIAATPQETQILTWLGKVMDIISVIVPRIDLMGQTSWLVYGVQGSDSIGFMKDAGPYAEGMMTHLGLMGFLSVQGCIFIFLLMTASAFDFARRRF